MAGILYGIGVGPGDPELVTVKAARIMRECEVLVVPGEDYRDSVAYRIAVQAVPEIAEKEIFGVTLPMTRDRAVQAAHQERAADQVAERLDRGQNVGFLNLGDVTVYASYIYIHRLVTARGYRTELVNGVPSFCAAASRLGIGLAENADELHIISQPDRIEEALRLPGTKIIMKMGRHMGRVREILKNADADVVMVENCGMPGERVYRGADAINEDAGYYSLLIVKERRHE